MGSQTGFFDPNHKLITHKIQNGQWQWMFSVEDQFFYRAVVKYDNNKSQSIN